MNQAHASFGIRIGKLEAMQQSMTFVLANLMVEWLKS